MGAVEVGFDEIGLRDESAPWLGDALESAERLDRQSGQYVYDEFTRQVRHFQLQSSVRVNVCIYVLTANATSIN